MPDDQNPGSTSFADEPNRRNRRRCLLGGDADEGFLVWSERGADIESALVSTV